MAEPKPRKGAAPRRGRSGDTPSTPAAGQRKQGSPGARQPHRRSASSTAGQKAHASGSGVREPQVGPASSGAALPREWPEDFRAGFTSFVGRPNAGKSTLTNALVGQKIAITSAKPQTTRHTIRGIVHRDDAQLVLVDTPGLHRPRTLLGQRLNDLVAETLSEVDAIGFCLPANEKIGPGDRFIASQLGQLQRKPVVAIVTKADLVDRSTLARQLVAVAELGTDALGDQGWTAVVPVSATADFQVTAVADVLVQQMPLSPPLYPDGELTDEPEAVMIAELIREAALEGVRDELPHSLAVVVEEIIPREGRPEDNPLLDIHVNLFVERPSQKAIVIGRAGSRLREVGTRARQGIEALMGTRVYLDLHVKIAKEWQRDPKQLGRLGF
ncbi:GTPase Era [Arthrobacter sp. JSM 101049]|uniref:GTPase Era n=1 Tax=Arthrobacter sp. JSM 101049 TaxID=929097 RepID=UPI003565FD71